MITFLRPAAAIPLFAFFIALGVGCAADTDDETTVTVGSATSSSPAEQYDEVRPILCTFASRTTLEAKLASTCTSCKVSVEGIPLSQVGRNPQEVAAGTYHGAIVGKGCGSCADAVKRALEGKGGTCSYAATSLDACRSFCLNEAHVTETKRFIADGVDGTYCACATSSRALRCAKSCSRGFAEATCNCRSAP